jgi:protein O-GlcNAc transferase
MTEFDDAFQEALEHHKSGNLPEAARLYEGIIDANPDHTDAMCNLAALKSAQGVFDEATDYYQKALTLMPMDPTVLTNMANMLVRKGVSAEAESYYRRALESDPSSITAFAGLGQALLGMERFNEAVGCFRQLVDQHGDSADAWRLLANGQFASGQRDEAAASLARCLELNPVDSDAAFIYGNLERDRKNYSRAIELYQLALNHSNHSTACDIAANLANTLVDAERIDEAVKVLVEVLRHFPDFAEGWNNLGSAWLSLERFDEAMGAFRKCLVAAPDMITAANNIGETYLKAGKPGEAWDWCQKLAEKHPDTASVWTGLGNVLVSLEKFDQARNAYDMTLEIEADDIDALHGRAVVNHRRATTFGDLSLCDNALADYQRVTELDDQHFHAFYNTGSVLQILNRHEEAIGSFQKALEIKPDYVAACSALAHSLQQCCKWDDLEAIRERVIALTRKEMASGSEITTSPFNLLQLSAPGDVRLAAAQHLASLFKHASADNSAQNFDYDWPKGDKLRIGYISPDFRNHSVGHSFLELLEAHDHDRFEFFGYHTSSAQDDITARIKSNFDVFVELDNLSFSDSARRINDDHIDILIDLAGHTRGSRFEILALKPAPVQVHFLGYGMTTGADYIDYLMTDEIKISANERPFVVENIIYLPHHCLPVSCPEIPQTGTSRSIYHLPEDGFVFADFNGHYKIDAGIFSAWMQILQRAPKSVLWLMDFPGPGSQNLKQEAKNHDIDPARLIFADMCPNSEHLARLKLADLALDTWHHAGGVTTTDALWAGLPVLTIQTEGMVDCMGASLLSAAELPELIASSVEDYQDKALEYYNNPSRLKGLREKLTSAHRTAPLFDTVEMARDVETAFEIMWQAHESGEQQTVTRVEARTK